MFKYQVLLIEFIILLSLKADDYSNGPSGASSISVGGSSKSGTIEVVGDEDWFIASLNAGVSYTVINQAVGGSDPMISVKGPAPSTSEIAFNDDYDDLSAQVIFTAPSTGSYYIVSLGYPDTTGQYSIRIFLTPIPCPTDCGKES